MYCKYFINTIGLILCIYGISPCQSHSFDFITPYDIPLITMTYDIYGGNSDYDLELTRQGVTGGGIGRNHGSTAVMTITNCKL